MENEFNVDQESTENTQAQNAVYAAERLEQLRSEQSLYYGIFFGTTAALLGAILWATITVLAKIQIGYMAVAVGFMVGYGVRVGGKGIDTIYGVIGAGLALLGCLLGNFLSQVGFIAYYTDLQYYEIFAELGILSIIDLMYESSSPIDLLFYGIALYEGYRFSFRKINR